MTRSEAIDEAVRCVYRWQRFEVRGLAHPDCTSFMTIGVIDRVVQDIRWQFRNIMRALEPAHWREIADAPQDSTEVLVCMNNGLGRIMIASTPGTGQWFDGLHKVGKPTHWMPLPSPPETKIH